MLKGVGGIKAGGGGSGEGGRRGGGGGGGQKSKTVPNAFISLEVKEKKTLKKKIIYKSSSVWK